MNVYSLKSLISKLTGVDLIKEAMPLFSGQGDVGERQMVWHRFGLDQELPENLPKAMTSDLHSMIGKFIDAYHRFVPNGHEENFKSMVFCWYGEDPSIRPEDLQAIQNSNIPQQYQGKMLEVANFIQQNGVPLLKSPREFERTRKTYDRDGQFNGGQAHLENFGWAWGARLIGLSDTGARRADHVPSTELNNPQAMSRKMADKNAVLVTVVTGEKDGGYGIFFDDGTELLPVVPEKFLQVMRQKKAKSNQPLNPDDPALLEVIKQVGNIERFFGFRSSHNPNDPSHQGVFTPCQKRFVLENAQDPAPKAIFWKKPGIGAKAVKVSPAHDGRTRDQFVGGTRRKPWIDPRVHVAMLRVNGTLYWQSVADPATQFPMTKQQVDYFNHYKGERYVVRDPGYQKYAFDNEQDRRKYDEDCVWLNHLRDFLSSFGRNHVASQKYHVIIVGPRFTAGKQVGKEMAPGHMSSPSTQVDDTEATPHGGKFTGRRNDWVVEKHEYDISQSRAAMKGNGFSWAQNVSGLGAISGDEADTCVAAITKALREYNLPPRVRPSDEEIQAAQQTFDAAQQYWGANTDNGDAMPVDTQPQQPQMNSGFPEDQTPQVSNENDQTDIGQQNVPVVQNKYPSLPKGYSKVNVFDTSANSILHRLRKLG